MKSISNKAIFGLSVLAGMSAVLAGPAYNRSPWPPRVTLTHLTEQIFVTEQVQLDAIRELKARGIATLVDLRPDGEAADQPSAAQVEAASHANQLEFAYVPVPRGDIPDIAVDALGKAIAQSPQPIVLYCRSGRRAARTWSLAEASRTGGLRAEVILAAVRAAGQSADDLSDAIARRIAHRLPLREAKR